ncbi:MAG TPA: DUF3267 domain-containing protein [Saprospiraceae bacterium]|nr:DUF3267 domain-containing protein [Saprospiraceae bacterium]
MDITPEALPEQNYRLIDQLGHQELVPFIQTYIKKRTRYAVFYYVINAVFFILITYLLFQGIKQPGYDLGSRFTQLSQGIALAFLLLPLHEYIHALAYRQLGAKQVYYDVNWKKFYVMALADRFVVNRKEFEIVALAPFVVITILLSLSLFLAPASWIIAISGALMMHSAMCSGDFGLLSYFQYYHDKDIVTFDDKASGVSYFYEKMK